MTDCEEMLAAELSKSITESAAKILVFCGRVDAEAHWGNQVRLDGWVELIKREAVAIVARIGTFHAETQS